MKNVLGVTLLALMTSTAMASSITVQDSGTPIFTGFNVGTSPTVGFQNSTTISGPGFDNIASITFSGAGTGVYAGSVLNVASNPYGLGPFGAAVCSACAEYFSVEPGGEITVTFNKARTSLDILWGTVDVAPGYNLVTTNTGQTIDGAMIDALMGDPTSGSTNAAVEIAGLIPFTSVTFQDTVDNVPAFEFDIGRRVTQTPIPGALPLFAGGLGLLGLLRRRKKGGAA